MRRPDRQPLQAAPVGTTRVTKRPVMRDPLGTHITVCLPNMTGTPQLSLRHRHTFPLHDVTSLRARRGRANDTHEPWQTGIHPELQGVAAPAAPASWNLVFHGTWWSQTGSNRRPDACKATALPAELWPRRRAGSRRLRLRRPTTMVGLGRLERPTSPLSGVRSNHLSYRPEPVTGSHGACAIDTRRPAIQASRLSGCLRKGNEGGVGSAKWVHDWTLYPMTPYEERTGAGSLARPASHPDKQHP